VLESIVSAVFDPVWNAQNRVAIWAAIVMVLFLSGFGLPAPEDVPLTMSGFTTQIQNGDRFLLWPFAVAFCTVTVPILLGDLVAYGMGRRWGFAIRDRFWLLRGALTDARLVKVRGWFTRFGSITVFLGRQVAGVRFVTFFTAGVMRMPVWKFVFWDFMGCLVSVPVWLTLGALAARYGRPWLDSATRTVGSTFLVVVVALAAGLLLFARLRGRDKRPGEEGEEASGDSNAQAAPAVAPTPEAEPSTPSEREVAPP
jgi:membrane protein DedA with SNARE-associated domain